jgi:hypothetical protein
MPWKTQAGIFFYCQIKYLALDWKNNLAKVFAKTHINVLKNLELYGITLGLLTFFVNEKK